MDFGEGGWFFDNILPAGYDKKRLSEVQKENILMAFGAEPEYDKYGIANAITLAAQKEETWEKSIELEKIGGCMIAIPLEKFKSLDEQ